MFKERKHYITSIKKHYSNMFKGDSLKYDIAGIFENKYKDEYSLIERYIFFHQNINNNISDSIPSEQLEKIESSAMNFSNIFSNLLQLSSRNDEIKFNREIIPIFEKIEKNYNNDIVNLNFFYFYSYNQFEFENEARTQIQTQLDELNNNFTIAQTTINQDQGRISELKSETEELVDSIKALLPETNINFYSKIFYDEAKRFRTKSFIWLTVTSIFAIIFLYISGSYYINITEQLHNIFTTISNSEKINPYDKNWIFIQYSISKLLIIVFILYATIWSGKNYKSNIHNSIINKHRYNALRSYETLIIMGKDSKDINSTILNKVADSIFIHHHTAFESKEKEDSVFNLFRPFKS